jgi:hypothetical protein
MKKDIQKEIEEAAGRLANVVDIGSITPAKIRTKIDKKSMVRDDNPINKMYKVLTGLLVKQGVKDITKTELSISDVLVTEKTEKMIMKVSADFLRGFGYSKKMIERELAFATLNTPATLRNKKVEKLMKLKDNRVYVAKDALEAALKSKKTKSA